MRKTKKTKKTSGKKTQKKTVVKKAKKSALIKLAKKRGAVSPKTELNIDKKTERIKEQNSNTSSIISENKAPSTCPPRLSAKIQNIRISPHLVDLKKIQAEKTLQKQLLEERANYIGEEIINALQDKKQSIYKNLQSTYKKIKPQQKLKSVKYTEPDSSDWEINETPAPKPKIKKNFTFPKIKLPRLQLPAISLPKLNIRKPKLPQIEINIGNLILPGKWLQTILAFIVFCIIFVLPFNLYAYYQNMLGKKNNIIDQATQALAHLTISQKAASAQEFYYTNLELQQSANNFGSANAELENINIIVKSLIQLLPAFNKQYTTAKSLLDSGERLSKDATLITNVLEEIKLSSNEGNLNLTTNILKLKDALNTTVPDLEIVQKNMQQIYLDEIPDEYRPKVEFLQATVPLMVDNIKFFISASDLLLKTLGHESSKRYLFLFQNNNEIRPTGGFIGSLALVDIDRGNIRKMEIPGGGPYDLKAGLQINLESPNPLHLMNTRWEFQDGNWFADLPTSAKKLMYLYEKSSGPTVDGIIFINATFLKNILELTGPIDLPDYRMTITKDNFFDEIQKNVELDYNKEENKPKQIIADLAPIIIDRLLHPNPQDFIKMFNMLLASLGEKEIQIYFTDSNLENFVLDNNWGGQLKKTEGDYLNIVSTNIAGEKTDGKVEQTAKLKVQIDPDGSIINTLTITKKHFGIKGQPFYGVPNVDYIRIYVPKGSELIKAEGFMPVDPEFFMEADPEIYEQDQDLLNIEKTKMRDPESQTETFTESGKTVFANWFQIAPGEIKSATITYRTPITLNFKQDNSISYQNIWLFLQNELNSYFGGEKLDQTYSLLWQKQSGKRNFDLEVEINFPKGLKYQYIYPTLVQTDDGVFNWQTALNTDKLIAIVFKR